MTSSARPFQPEPTTTEYRSASTNAALGLAAFSAVTQAAPYVHAAIDKITGPKDDGQHVVIAPGTVSPTKDD